MKRLIGTLILTILATSAFGQSLADVAKKEKDRRARLGSTPSETITDVELRRAGGPTSESTVTIGEPTASGDGSEADGDGTAEDGAAPVETVEEDPTETREYWQNRLRSVNQRIATIESQLQSPEMTSDPRGAQRRQTLESQLATARAEHQTIVQEGRRKGVPAGWLR